MGNRLGTTGVFNVLKVDDLLFYILARGQDMVYPALTSAGRAVQSILQESTAPRPRVDSL